MNDRRKIGEAMFVIVTGAALVVALLMYGESRGAEPVKPVMQAAQVRQPTITRVTRDGKPYGTAVAIGTLDGEVLFGLCDHQTSDVDVEIGGRKATTLWSDREGTNDAAIVSVKSDARPGTLYDGEYVGRATIYGYPGLGRRLRGFSGRTDERKLLTAPVPSYRRQGMSGGGVYAPDGRLVGIFSGYVTDQPHLNTFTPTSVYVDAVEELCGECDGRP